jgi:hypothetical protein
LALLAACLLSLHPIMNTVVVTAVREIIGFKIRPTEFLLVEKIVHWIMGNQMAGLTLIFTLDSK